MDSVIFTPSTFVIAGLGITAYMMLIYKGKGNPPPQTAKDNMVLGILTATQSEILKCCIDGDGNACFDLNAYYDSHFLLKQGYDKYSVNSQTPKLLFVLYFYILNKHKQLL